MVYELCFHLVACIHFYFGFWYDRIYVTEPDSKWRGYEFGGRLVYLTIWNMIMQCVYFTLALSNDIFGSNEVDPKSRPLIRKIRDYVFGTYAFPFAMNVGLLFHVLMMIDRKLVMPPEVDEFFPFWLNHTVHTNIMIFVLLELFFIPRKYPSRKTAMVGLFIIIASYLGWIFCIKANTNYWVYPVLEKLDLPLRIGFFGFTVAVPLALYFLGEYLNSLRWGKKIKSSKN